MYTMEYYSAMRKEDILPFATVRVAGDTGYERVHKKKKIRKVLIQERKGAKCGEVHQPAAVSFY